MWIKILTDPLFRGPTLATLLMCMLQALIGVYIFVAKKSLLGEVVSHATYPGVILGLLAWGLFQIQDPWIVFVGAFVFGCLGMYGIKFLESKKVPKDSALCVCLAVFFGIGTLLASYVQQQSATYFRWIQIYLYGQAATMEDRHILIYALFLLGVITMILIWYRYLKLLFFDPHFARAIGISLWGIEILFFVMFASSIVLGIRSVGIMLIAGALIFPPLIARCYTYKLSSLLLVSACIGGFCGYLGNYFSVVFYDAAASTRLCFPTGPMVIVVGSVMTFLAFICAPHTGGVAYTHRYLRRWKLRKESLLLEGLEGNKLTLGSVLSLGYFRLRGWITKDRLLTDRGRLRAVYIQEIYECRPPAQGME